MARRHAKQVEPLVRPDSHKVQLAVAAAGVGVALVPEPSAQHYGLVKVNLAATLQADAAAWPTNELYWVTHRALRDVPRVRAVWDLLLKPPRERGR